MKNILRTSMMLWHHLVLQNFFPCKISSFWHRQKDIEQALSWGIFSSLFHSKEQTQIVVSNPSQQELVKATTTEATSTPNSTSNPLSADSDMDTYFEEFVTIDICKKQSFTAELAQQGKASEGHGLDSQEHRCREYARQRGYEVVRVFRDSFSGGGDFMNRPAMSALLGYLDKKPATNYVEYAKWGVSRRIGHHEPIISLDTFLLNQDKLNGKVKIQTRKDNSKEFPLRGFILCSGCDKTLTASWSTGRNGKHPYYHCMSKECSLKGKSIRRKDVEDGFRCILRSIRPKERTLNLTKEIPDGTVE